MVYIQTMQQDSIVFQPNTMKKNKRKTKQKAASTSSGDALKTPAQDDEVPPRQGWLVELDEALEAAAKANEETLAQAQVRIAVAACKLRQWKKAITACESGLAALRKERPDYDTLKQKLRQHHKVATKELAAYQDRSARTTFKDLFDGVRKGNVVIEQTLCEHVTFGNLNILHYACMVGDVHLLEDAVAAGAAIDFPVLEENNAGPYPAPPGTTALLLLVSSLAAYALLGNTSGLITPQLKRVLQGNEECAIALIQLGADAEKKLPRPRHPASTDPMDPNVMYQTFKLYGKTARELAMMSGKPRLIKVLKEFETKQDKIDKAHCRCGSRLPWLQCHAGEEIGRSPIYMDGKDNQVMFRYSPMAKCPCNHTNKKHFYCCWKETPRPTYQNDSTSELTGNVTVPVNNNPLMESFAQAVAQRKQEMIDRGEDMNQPLFPQAAGKETADMIRQVGSLSLLQFDSHPKSKIHTWDPEVYAGCIERINNDFMWNDVHWLLDKSELLVRVEEWNEALERYCDDQGLIGAQREAVVARHRASPFAPCGNPSCHQVEEEVKSFKRCSRCKSIAYCGSSCQHADWKRHKQECIPR